MRRKWLSLVVSGAVVAGLATPLTSTATAQAPRKKADLTVTAVTAPARATIGAKATLKVKVKNKGTLKAARSVTAFSPLQGPEGRPRRRAQADEGDAQAQAAQDLVGSAAVTIPASTTPGRYYVVACADAARKVQGEERGQQLPGLRRRCQVDEPASSHELIDEAVENGELTEEQGLTYKVFSDFKDPRLPGEVRRRRPGRPGGGGAQCGGRLVAGPERADPGHPPPVPDPAVLRGQPLVARAVPTVAGRLRPAMRPGAAAPAVAARSSRTGTSWTSPAGSTASGGSRGTPPTPRRRRT